MKKSLSNMKSMDKGAVMSFIVHSADISHPTKTWELHERWTAGLVEEFFRQGDAEKERGTPLIFLVVQTKFSTKKKLVSFSSKKRMKLTLILRIALFAALRSRNNSSFAKPNRLYRFYNHSDLFASFVDFRKRQRNAPARGRKFASKI